MKGYIASNIDKERLLDSLRSLLNGQETFRGCIEAQVGPFKRAVLITSQRIIHVLPDDYAFVDALPRYSIKSHERYTDSNLYRVEVKHLKTSHIYTSANAVDMMWMQRTLEEKPEPIPVKETEEHFAVGAGDEQAAAADLLKTDGVDNSTDRGFHRDDKSRKGKLKECKTCGKDVAPFASKCPNCGEKNPTVTTKDMWVGLGVLVVIAVIISPFFSTKEDKDERLAGYGPCIERKRDSTGYISTSDVQECIDRHLK